MCHLNRKKKSERASQETLTWFSYSLYIHRFKDHAEWTLSYQFYMSYRSRLQISSTWIVFHSYMAYVHGLRTPREEIPFTARPKIHSHSQIFRYGGSIFCLPHRPIFSDILDLCLHWVSVVRGRWSFVRDLQVCWKFDAQHWNAKFAVEVNSKINIKYLEVKVFAVCLKKKLWAICLRYFFLRR